jgi:hypothetical protein
MDGSSAKTAPRIPSASVRVLVGVLVFVHLIAIVIAVTSSGSPGFPAPQLSLRLSPFVQPYLQAIFLNNAYRFFAPNPGTPWVLWFRLQYSDGMVRWIELPGRPERLWRGRYQRRLNLAIQLGQYVESAAASDEKKTLSPLGKMLVESAARHVAVAYARTSVNGSLVTIRNIGIYCVRHGVILPEQVRAGWEPIDLRTYQATFVGAYSPEGERVDEFRPDLVEQPIARVAASIIDVDVLPRVRERAGASLDGVFTEVSLPEPINRLVRRHVDLLDASSADDLTRRIETLLPEAVARP